MLVRPTALIIPKTVQGVLGPAELLAFTVGDRFGDTLLPDIFGTSILELEGPGIEADDALFGVGEPAAPVPVGALEDGAEL
jgi:hypothetical protein